MWEPGDVIAWRGIFRGRIWHALPTYVVKDTPQELVLAVLPGTVCKVEQQYNKGKNGKRIWDYKDADWELHDFTWHTNRLLLILEPEKYYCTNLFWNQEANKFIGYYVNFQQPFQRSYCGIDALDLELDIAVDPDLHYKWKDIDDYHKAIECGVIPPEYVNGIEAAKPEILERIENCRYPFDGSWLNWMPDPNWLPPALPENWYQI